MEELQELRPALDRHLHVLDDRFLDRLVAPPVDAGGHAVFAVEGDQAAVDVGAHPAARHERAHHRLLHAEGPRAPEPVGVPAPQVVADGQPVAAAVPDRLVVDAHAGVVGGVGRAVGEAADREVHLARAEEDPVHEVDAFAVVHHGVADLLHGQHALGGVGELDVREVHVRLDLAQPDLDAQRVAERAVGVGEGAEEVAVLVVGAGHDDAPVAGEDLELLDRLVRQPSLKLVDSMPSPVTAPPSVMVLSCGTTYGMSPCGSVASTRCSYVVMPWTSAVMVSGSTLMTSSRSLAESLAVFVASRNLNRLDVDLASRGAAPPGISA